MKIRIQKNYLKDEYIADCTDLPGAPYIGEGSTEDKAIISLLHRLLAERDNKFNTSIEIEHKS